MTLVNDKKDAGRYSVPWDASRFSRGIHFYKLEEGRYAKTRKVLLMK
jgi:hypothetical protein